MISSSAASRSDLVQIGSRNGLSLAISPRSKKSIGSVVADRTSPELISGVRIEPLQVYADDRGFFIELARLGKGLASDFTASEGQVQASATLSYPGTIKAIHFHYEQTDLWAPIKGMLQVLLCDLRCDSPSFGRLNTLYVGQHRQWSILIPPGVGHGYKVLGNEVAMLIYLTNRFYSPEDEGRLAWDDPAIAYDWETQHK